MKGVVVYRHDEAGWRWELMAADGSVISASSEKFLTRRGAMDDWNAINRVVERLAQYGSND